MFHNQSHRDQLVLVPADLLSLKARCTMDDALLQWGCKSSSIDNEPPPKDNSAHLDIDH